MFASGIYVTNVPDATFLVSLDTLFCCFLALEAERVSLSLTISSTAERGVLAWACEDSREDLRGTELSLVSVERARFRAAVDSSLKLSSGRFCKSSPSAAMTSGISVSDSLSKASRICGVSLSSADMAVEVCVRGRVST